MGLLLILVFIAVEVEILVNWVLRRFGDFMMMGEG